MSSRHSHDEHGRSHIGTPGHKPYGYQAEPGADAATPMSERPHAFEQAIVRLSTEGDRVIPIVWGKGKNIDQIRK